MTPPQLIIQTLSAIKILKAQIYSYPLYKLVLQNSLNTQAKQKLSKYYHSRMTERIYSNKILENNYDEREIHLLIHLKYTVILADPKSPFKICHITRALSSMKPLSEILYARQLWPQTTIANNKIQLHVSQCILYIILVVLIPPQICFKIFHRFQGSNIYIL